MGALRGTIQDGKAVFDPPPDWPDGTPVAVEPIFGGPIGLSEEDWPADATGIAALLARIGQLPPS